MLIGQTHNLVTYDFQDFNSEIQGSVSKILVTDARKRYSERYGEDVELNKKFNEFVWNYQLAYQGPNTLKGQIDANVKKANKTGKIVTS